MSSRDKTATAVEAEQGGTVSRTRERALTTPPKTDRSEVPGVRVAGQVSLWQLNLLRVGYLVMGGGLAVVKWPLLFNHGPWELKEGTVECMLVAMSVLALVGLRYPLRMLPILLFEVAWKVTWLGVVALPLWLGSNELDSATREQAGAVLWVVIIIAVIPWRQVLTRYVIAPGDPWRRSR
jgi:hypothetical protein